MNTEDYDNEPEEFDYAEYGDEFFEDAEERPRVICGVGWHLFRVVDIKQFATKKRDKLLIDLKVISEGPDKDKDHVHLCPINDKPGNVKKRIRWAVALKLATIEQFKQGKVAIDWHKAIGRAVAGNVTEDHYEDDHGVRKVSLKIQWPRDIVTADYAISKGLVNVKPESLQSTDDDDPFDEMDIPF